jgi:hypothetical protein
LSSIPTPLSSSTPQHLLAFLVRFAGGGEGASRALGSEGSGGGGLGGGGSSGRGSGWVGGGAARAGRKGARGSACAAALVA